MRSQIVPGMRFGIVTTVEAIKLPGRRGTFWRCLCDCGGASIKYDGFLRTGKARSCGCIKGANRTHRMSGTPEYKAWDNARDRCRNPKNKKYPLYGGRGIRFCERWSNSFANFLEDMGRKPTPQHSLEREDSNKDYEPDNCIWATIIVQNNNRSFNRHLMVGDQKLTIAQAARLTGIPHGTILGRLNAGKSDAEAIRHE